MYYGNDPFFVLIIIALGLSLLAQWRVHSTYKRFAQVSAARGLPAEEVARQILSHYRVDIPINQVPGNLTDHYDPRRRTLALSQGVYGSHSIAAYGIAAHEAGHAIQDAVHYKPMVLRSLSVPLASFGSNTAFLLFFVGIVMQSLHFLAWVGIVLFSFVVVCQIVTLPVEFNASTRAKRQLSALGLVSDEQAYQVKKVLNTAALTYVAGTLMALLQLLYLLSRLAGSSRD